MAWSDPWARDPVDQPHRQPVEILPVLWRYRWMLLGVAVGAAALAYGLSLLQPTRYTATAQMILSDPATPGCFATKPASSSTRCATCAPRPAGRLDPGAGPGGRDHRQHAERGHPRPAHLDPGLT